MFSTGQILGQTTISGKIADMKGVSIPGANVFIKDTYDGITTDIDGNYAFVTDETGQAVLVVSFMGYKTQEISLELPGPAVRIDVSLKEEIVQLNGVVITAGSFTAGEEGRRTILKAIDIATTAGATADIAGALNTLPGTQKVGESGRLFVRGGDGYETKTFIDGLLVLDAYSPAAPNTPSRGRFLPFMFKGTSFSTGGYSAEYGQATSSALVLNSKDKPEINQTDIGLLSVGADIAHTQVWGDASWIGKIQYTDIRPYFNLINQRVDWETPPVSIEGSTAYRQKIGEHGILKFFGNYNQTEYALYEHSIQDPDQKFLYKLKNTFGYGNGSFGQMINQDWNIRGGFSYSYNENKTEIEGLPFNNQGQGLHGKLVFENSISDHVEIGFGSEVIHRRFDQTTISQNGDQQIAGFDEPIIASFFEAQVFASNKFVTRAGLRGEHNPSANTFNVDPRLSFAYKPGEDGQFSFAYGTFRQGAQDQHLMINPNLSEERAEHFILNYQLITNDRTFRVEGYYKNYHNLIKYINFKPQDLSNEGYGYARGLEFFWRDNKTLRNVDYWVSYSYLDTQRDYLNYPGSYTPTFASKHNFSLVYKHFITPLKSQLGVTYSYTSSRAYNDPNLPEFNSGRTPYYMDLSANISYLPKPYLIIHVSCTNLVGRDNIFGYQYSAVPDANGYYPGKPIEQPAKRFLFLAVLITLSKNKSVSQLPNL